MADYEISTIGDLGTTGACSCSESMGDVASEAMAITAGGWLPTVVWPSDVDAYKRKLDPDMNATEATASRCANLSSGEAVAWGDFFTSWKKFRDEPTPIFGAANKFDEAKSYEARLRDWQEQIGETCKLTAPGIHPPGSGPLVSTSTKWLIGGVAVLVLGAIGFSFYKAGKGAYRTADAGRRYLEDEIVPRALPGASFDARKRLPPRSSTALARRR